jgi:hypothetical protein
MEGGKWTAIVVTATPAGVTAAEGRDHFVPLDRAVDISHDAGPIGGTAIYQVAELGFVTLDSRTPIEVRQERRTIYRGGAITLEEPGYLPSSSL